MELPAEQLWRQLIELSPEGRALTRGPEHLIDYANAAFCQLAHQDRKQLVSRRFVEAFGDVDGAMLDRVYATGCGESSADHEHALPDGKRRYLSYAVARLTDASEQAWGLTVTAKDTTDQVLVRAELALAAGELRRINERLVISSVREQEHAEAAERQRAQLNALLENISEGVIVADATGRVLLLNEAARVIMAVGKEDLQTIDDLQALDGHGLDGSPLTGDERPVSRALHGAAFAGYELFRVRPDGDARRIVTTGTSVKDENGNVVLAIVIFRDVTELRRLEQQREEYTALVSHDLRVPLSNVLMLIYTLKKSLEKKGLGDEVQITARVEQNAGRINAMIKELVEATSLEAQGVELRRVACDLRELVGGLVKEMDEANGGRIAIEAQDASYRVLADPTRLERAISNLVTNALKYSPAEAPVKLVLARRGDSEIALEVVDRGMGIPPENLYKLFERYYRAPTSKRVGGLGLGLYITRLVAEAHGGRVEVLSDVGKGSTFRLVLPSHAASS